MIEQHVFGPDVGQRLWLALKAGSDVDGSLPDLYKSQEMKTSLYWKRSFSRARKSIDKFVDSILIDDGCWLWQGPRANKGYGQHSFANKNRSAHTWAYVFFRGAVPNGMEVDHICFTPACVRPSHLQLLTVSANRARKRTMLEQRCLKGHPRTPENVYLYRDRRVCRICRYEQQLAWKRRNGLAS
jgi:hypothetical protein